MEEKGVEKGKVHHSGFAVWAVAAAAHPRGFCFPRSSSLSLSFRRYPSSSVSTSKINKKKCVRWRSSSLRLLCDDLTNLPLKKDYL
jgi:hypothetical protein